MVSVYAAVGFVDLCLAFAALELFSFLNSHCGAGTTTTTCGDEAPLALLDSAAEVLVLPPLAAVAVLFVTVALMYHHLMTGGRRVDVDVVPVAVAAGGAGNGRRSISGRVMFALCASVGALQFIVFGGQAASGVGDAGHGAWARALGLAALRALPGAATATFFLGMILVIVGHVRAGGEGGGTGGGGAVDADGGAIQGKALLLLLTRIAAGAAAALLVCLMAMALTLTLYGGAKY